MSAELRPGGGASQALSWRTNDQDRWSLVLHRALSLIEFSSSNPSLTDFTVCLSLSFALYSPSVSIISGYFSSPLFRTSVCFYLPHLRSLDCSWSLFLGFCLISFGELVSLQLPPHLCSLPSFLQSLCVCFSKPLHLLIDPQINPQPLCSGPTLVLGGRGLIQPPTPTQVRSSALLMVNPTSI